MLNGSLKTLYEGDALKSAPDFEFGVGLFADYSFDVLHGSSDLSYPIWIFDPNGSTGIFNYFSFNYIRP
jgi:hypothetical protein